MIPEVPWPVKSPAKRTGSCSASPPGADIVVLGGSPEHSPESSGTCHGFKTFWTRIKNRMKKTQNIKRKEAEEDSLLLMVTAQIGLPGMYIFSRTLKKR